MKFFTSFGLLALASAAFAATNQTQQLVARKCINATVPVTISSRNGVFNIPTPQTNDDVTAFILNSTRQGNNFTAEALTGYATINKTYQISTQFCQPANSSARNPVVQVLTHGIGFDKTYWDLSFNNYNYSYVNSALAAGYCTLAYDRLGIGNSSHGEPINEIQAFLEIQAMRALTQQLRTGQFPGVNHTFGNNIVHVGHSFGSTQTYVFSAMYPNETSGIVLQGFSANATFLPYFELVGSFVLANQNQPFRLGNANPAAVENFINFSPFADLLTPIDLTTLPPALNYPNGYIINDERSNNLANFLRPGRYDPAILTLGEQTKQPVTYGELLTIGSQPKTNPFTGPVLVVTGQYDVPFCGGDCLATGGAAPSIPDQARMAFTANNASNFTSYIQPNTAHGINLHYNSTASYQVIQNFLRSKNLRSS